MQVHQLYIDVQYFFWIEFKYLMHWDRRCQDFEMFFLCYRTAKYKCKCNAIGLFAICHNVGIKFDQFVLVLGDLGSQSFQIHIPHFSIQIRLSHFVTGMVVKC